MNVILTNGVDYQSVRRAIDTTLDDGITVEDERMVPDAVIADPVCLGHVENEVLKWLGQTTFPGTLTESQQSTVKLATIYLVAARVYPRIPIITQEQIGEHRWRREYETVEDVVARLSADGMELLYPLLEAGGAIVSLVNASRFRRACGRRGY